MHTAYPSLDAAMVLFQSIVEISVGSVRDRLAEFSADRPRVSIVPIAGDPSNYPPAKPGALRFWPLKAADGVADAAPGSGGH